MTKNATPFRSMLAIGLGSIALVIVFCIGSIRLISWVEKRPKRSCEAVGGLYVELAHFPWICQLPEGVTQCPELWRTGSDPGQCETE